MDFYDKGGIPNENLDQQLVKLNLSDRKKRGLMAFLKALDGQPVRVTIPTDFPQ